MLKASGVASKILALALLLAPLSTIALVAAAKTSNPYLVIVTAVWALLYAIAAVVAMAEAVTMYRRGNLAALGASARLVKYCSIPFFMGNFALLAGLTGLVLLFSSMFALGGVTGAMAMFTSPILGAGTYLIMLPTSAYGIAGAVLLFRQGRASKAFAVMNVILHLLFVVDIFSTLVVANRVKPGPANPARMVAWIAGVVVMAMLVPAALYSYGTATRQEEQRVAQQSSEGMSALPGVSGVTDRTVELVRGVTPEQAHVIAVKGYTLQNSSSPRISSPWILKYGSAQLVLSGTEAEPGSTQALVLLGPVDLDDGLILNITAQESAKSNNMETAVEIIGPVSTNTFPETTAKVIRRLAVVDPPAASSVDRVSGFGGYVGGDRVRSATTAEQLEALGALLSDDVKLFSLALEPTTSEVTLQLKNEDQTDAVCELGLEALADSPGLLLEVLTTRPSARGVIEC